MSISDTHTHKSFHGLIDFQEKIDKLSHYPIFNFLLHMQINTQKKETPTLFSRAILKKTLAGNGHFVMSFEK